MTALLQLVDHVLGMLAPSVGIVGGLMPQDCTKLLLSFGAAGVRRARLYHERTARINCPGVIPMKPEWVKALMEYRTLVHAA